MCFFHLSLMCFLSKPPVESGSQVLSTSSAKVSHCPFRKKKHEQPELCQWTLIFCVFQCLVLKNWGGEMVMRLKVKERIGSGTGALCFRYKHLSRIYRNTCLTHVSRFAFLCIPWTPCPSHRHGGLLPTTHPTSHPDGDWHPPKDPQCFWVWLPPPRAGAGRQWMRIPTPTRDGRREVSRHIPFLPHPKNPGKSLKWCLIYWSGRNLCPTTKFRLSLLLTAYFH